MEAMFYDMQRKSQHKKQYSLIMIDPHSDTARRVLYFAHNTDKKRLVYISSTINREANTTEPYTAIVNPFEHDGTEQMKYLLAQELTDALAELLADTSHSLTVQMTALIRPVISVVLNSPNPSMETVARFFLDKDGMNADLLELGKKSTVQQHRTFFEHDWYSVEYTLTKRSIRTKILYFLSDPMLANMLNGKSTVNINDCLEKGKVIIFNLPKGAGKFTSHVFSKLMIAYINALMFRREAIEPKKRKQCYVFLDEFQTILGNSLASSLSELRKYGYSAILATQSVKAISNLEIRKTVMLNTNLKAVGMTDYEDRVIFSRELGVSADDLGKLETLQFYVKKNDGKHTAFKFRVPILHSRYFLTASQRKELMDYLVYQSGIYAKVVPPPAPPLKSTREKKSQKQEQLRTVKRKTTKDNPFDENFLKPAFS
jgi:hypothetical protein